MAIINTERRGDPHSFGSVPRSVLAHNAQARPPSSLSAFAELANAVKALWLEEWPEWSELVPRLLRKDLRNSIGHASAFHDVQSGEIKTASGSISYLELTAATFALAHPLLVALQLSKTVRLVAADSAVPLREDD